MNFSEVCTAFTIRAIIALMMEAVWNSETLVNLYQQTQCYNPVGSQNYLIIYTTKYMLNEHHLKGNRNFRIYWI
jgi:hypothetical protein